VVGLDDRRSGRRLQTYHHSLLPGRRACWWIDLYKTRGFSGEDVDRSSDHEPENQE
jgi:hypothetical protein